MYYDGVSITPYETLFVPVTLGYVQNGWSFVQTAAKYEEWLNAQVRLFNVKGFFSCQVSWCVDGAAKYEEWLNMQCVGTGCRHGSGHLLARAAFGLVRAWEGKGGGHGGLKGCPPPPRLPATSAMSSYLARGPS